MPGLVKGLILSFALALGASACASQRPYVSVVGTAQAPGDTADRHLVVVVEIHNPTGTPLRLSELEYTLGRHGTEMNTRGKVLLRDTIAPGHTSTVDIAVPLAAGSRAAAAYDLNGRLHGYAGEIEMNWKIAALAQPSGG
jgi:LEA14-like dessication related protein